MMPGIGARPEGNPSSLHTMARVRLFANLREIAGASQVDIEGDTVAEVLAALVNRYGRDFERRMETARIWKNGNEGAVDDPVTDGDELALIPPVSGGAAPGIAGGGLESLLLAGLTLLLLGANVLGVDFLVALWVGVAALWVIDLASASSDGDFKIDYQPLLAAIVVSMATSNTFGLSGLGIGVAFTVVIVMGWTIIRSRARDLTTIAASALCALIASLSVSSILLARASVSGAGEGNIAGLLIVAILGAIAGRLAERSPSRKADPYMMASVVMVLAALGVAYLADFPRLGWFFIGLVMAGAVIAGRGIGSAFRTGRIQLAVRPDGILTALGRPDAGGGRVRSGDVVDPLISPPGPTAVPAAGRADGWLTWDTASLRFDVEATSPRPAAGHRARYRGARPTRSLIGRHQGAGGGGLLRVPGCQGAPG